MSEGQLVSIIGVMFTIICALVAWGVNGIMGRLLSIQMSMGSIEASIVRLVERVVRVETRCDTIHGPIGGIHGPSK